MQNILNHILDRLSDLTGKHRKNLKFGSSYYTALSYDVKV